MTDKNKHKDSSSGKFQRLTQDSQPKHIVKNDQKPNSPSKPPEDVIRYRSEDKKK